MVRVKQSKLWWVVAAGAIITGAAGLFFTQWLHKTSQAQLLAALAHEKNEFYEQVNHYFDSQITVAEKVLAIEPLRAALVSADSRAVTNELAVLQTVTNHWNDVFMVTPAGVVSYSLHGTVTLGTKTKDIPALDQLHTDVRLLLCPRIAEFSSIPNTETWLLMIGFPVIQQKKTIGMLVAVIDQKIIEQEIAAINQRLKTEHAVTIAKQRVNEAVLLFGTPSDPSQRFKHPFPRKADLPVAHALEGDLGESIKLINARMIASARTFIPAAQWAVAIQQDTTGMHNRFILFWYYALGILLLGLVLLVVALWKASSVVTGWLQRSYRILFFFLLSIGFLVSVICFSIFLKNFQIDRLGSEQANIAKAKTDVNHVASLLVKQSYETQAAVRRIILDIASHELKADDVSAFAKRGKQIFTDMARVAAFGINYTTTGVPIVHAWHRLNDKFEPVSIEKIQWNHEKATTAYWTKPLVQPELSPELITIFAEPFPGGFVWAAVPYAAIKETMAELGQDRLRNILMFDRDGLIVFHPDIDYVRQRTEVAELWVEKSEKELSDVEARAKAGYSGSKQFKDMQGGRHLAIFESLPHLQWTMVVLYDETDFAGYERSLQRKAALALIVLVLFMIFGTGLITQLYETTLSVLRRFCVPYSLILMFGIFALIYLNYQYSAAYYKISAIESKIVADRVREQLETVRGKNIIPLKTGAKIRFFDLVTPNKVVFSGIAWQTVDRKIGPNVKLGIQLQNISDKIETKELYSQKTGSEETVYWQIQGTIHQINPAYGQIPFDTQSVSWALVPLDQADPVFLEPDLESYPIIDPGSKPGVEQTFQMKDYVVERSFFNYGGTADKPTLQFTILVKRNLLSASLQYLLSLLVILATLYMISLMVVEDVVIRTQISVITAIAGLFFALILLHQNYRSSLAISGISYLETIIIAAYLALGYSYINVLLFMNRPEARPYKVALYWPAFLTYMFVMTIVMFY